MLKHDLPTSARNLDMAQALSQIGDADTLRDMLRLLEESLRQDLPQIGVLLEQGEVRGANRLLHPFKGFLPIFCHPQLCEMVSQVEALSKAPDVEPVRRAYALLRPELESLHQEVIAHLRAGGAS